MLNVVHKKFIAPKIDAIPAACKLKIAKSTAPPECAKAPDNGGYNVHPVPAPDSIKVELISNRKADIKNQKLILFNRGKDISGIPINNGINQFPNPPIKIGITIKKIIIKACPVTST